MIMSAIENKLPQALIINQQAVPSKKEVKEELQYQRQQQQLSSHAHLMSTKVRKSKSKKLRLNPENHAIRIKHTDYLSRILYKNYDLIISDLQQLGNEHGKWTTKIRKNYSMDMHSIYDYMNAVCLWYQRQRLYHIKETINLQQEVWKVSWSSLRHDYTEDYKMIGVPMEKELYYPTHTPLNLLVTMINEYRWNWTGPMCEYISKLVADNGFLPREIRVDGRRYEVMNNFHDYQEWFVILGLIVNQTSIKIKHAQKPSVEAMTPLLYYQLEQNITKYLEKPLRYNMRDDPFIGQATRYMLQINANVQNIQRHFKIRVRAYEPYLPTILNMARQYWTKPQEGRLRVAAGQYYVNNSGSIHQYPELIPTSDDVPLTSDEGEVVEPREIYTNTEDPYAAIITRLHAQNTERIDFCHLSIRNELIGMVQILKNTGMETDVAIEYIHQILDGDPNQIIRGHVDEEQFQDCIEPDEVVTEEEVTPSTWVSFIKTKIHNVKCGFTNAAITVKNKFSEIVAKVFGAIHTRISGSSTIGSIVNGMKTTFDMLHSMVSSVVGGMMTVINKVHQQVQRFFASYYIQKMKTAITSEGFLTTLIAFMFIKMIQNNFVRAAIVLYLVKYFDLYSYVTGDVTIDKLESITETSGEEIDFYSVISTVITTIMIGFGFKSANSTTSNIADYMMKSMFNLRSVKLGVSSIVEVTRSIVGIFKGILGYFKGYTQEEEEGRKQLVRMFLMCETYGVERGLIHVKRSKRLQEYFIAGQPMMLKLRQGIINGDMEKKYKNPTQRMAIRDSLRKYDNIMNVIHRANYFAGFRKTPFHVQLVGSPGVGKSTMINTIVNSIKTAYYTDIAETNLIFSKNDKSDYYDGYTNQPIMIADDIWKYADPKMITEILSLVSNGPMPVPMAHLEDKLTYFDSEWIISTTNTPYPRVNDVLDILAVHRRRHILVDVKIDERVYNKASGKFDMELYKQHYDGIDITTLPHLKFTIIKPVRDDKNNIDTGVVPSKDTAGLYQVHDNKLKRLKVQQPPHGPCEYEPEDELPAGLRRPLVNLNYAQFIVQMHNRYIAMRNEEDAMRRDIDKSFMEKYTQLEMIDAVIKSENILTKFPIYQQMLTDTIPTHAYLPEEMTQDPIVENAAVNVIQEIEAIASTSADVTNTNDDATPSVVEIRRLREAYNRRLGQPVLDGTNGPNYYTMIAEQPHYCQLGGCHYGERISQVAICERMVAQEEESANIRNGIGDMQMDEYGKVKLNIRTLMILGYGLTEAESIMLAMNGQLDNKFLSLVQKNGRLPVHGCNQKTGYHFNLAPFMQALSRLALTPRQICTSSYIMDQANIIRDVVALNPQLADKLIRQLKIESELQSPQKSLWRNFKVNVLPKLVKIRDSFIWCIGTAIRALAIIIPIVCLVLYAALVMIMITVIIKTLNMDDGQTSKVYFKQAPRPHLVGTSMEASQCHDDIMRKIRRNVTRVCIGGTTYANMLGIENHLAVINTHTIAKHLESGQPFTIEFAPTTRVMNDMWKIEVHPQELHTIQESDVTYIHSTNLPPYRSIKKFVVHDKELQKTMIPETLHHIYYDSAGEFINNIYNTAELQNNFIFRTGIYKRHFRHTLSYHGTAVKGSSGGPILGFSNYQPTCIYAIQSHTAGGINYSAIITQQEIEEVKNYFRDSIIMYEEPELDETSATTQELITGHIEVVGEVAPEEVVGMLPKTKYARTVLADEFPSERIPAILNPFDERVPEGTHPLQHSINKAGRDIMTPIPQCYMDMAVEGVTTFIQTKKQYKELPILTTKEAITGLKLPGYTPVNVKSSPGLPWIYDKKKTGKRTWIDFNEEGELILCDELVIQEVERFEGLLAQRIVPEHIIYEFPKDELRPTAKALGPPIKTRSISVMNMVWNIIYRKYVGSLDAWMQGQARGHFPCCVGINPQSMSWRVMYDELKARNNVGFDFDVSNWDGHYTAQIYTSVANVICNVMGYKKNTKEYNIIHTMLLGACYSLFQFANIVCRKKRGLPSGCPGTGPVNTLGHYILFTAMYMELTKDQPQFQHMEAMTTLVAVFFYGDDVIGTLNPLLNLTCKDFANLYEKYGWPITTAAKDGEIVDRPVEDLTFLKRSFVKIKNYNVIMGAIDKGVINDLLHWLRVSHNSYEQLYLNIHEALEFAFPHGEEFYNNLLTRINNTLIKHSRRPYHYSYSSMRIMLLERYYNM